MSDKKKIELAVSNLEKVHGKNCVMQMGKRNALPVQVIPTGILSVDNALVIGGFPRGRVVEVYGPESSGKTTLALQVIAQAHAMGGEAFFIDAEHALDPKYASALGVDMKRLWLSQPDYGEQALELASGLIKCGEFDIGVIDSVAALVPKAELDGEFGDSHMGLQARLMSQAMRKLTGDVARTKTCLVFINQIREKIGIVFGNPEVTTGGRALKFYSSMRVEVRGGALVKDGEKVTGRQSKIKIVKNKLGEPFREATPEMVFGQGFSQLVDLLNVGSDLGVLEKSGSWYSYMGERIGQGRDNAAETLALNAELTHKIYEEAKAKLFPPPPPEEKK